MATMAAAHRPGPTGDDDREGTDGLDLDALSRASGVPARTVRYYRQIGLLDPPVRDGRRAFYAADQLPRLERIASLRERGMALDAIARILDEADGEREVLSSLLALGDDLRSPWVEDRSATMSEAEVLAAFGSEHPEVLPELEANGIVYRRPGRGVARWDVPSVALLRLSGRLVGAGVDPALAHEAHEVLQVHLGALAEELVALFTGRVGAGFAGAGEPDEVREGVDELRHLALVAVQLVFAREMEQILARFVEGGGVFDLERRRHHARR